MNKSVLNATEALDVLLSGDRPEIGTHFGVGLLISANDTVDKVIEKCESYLDRYARYIKNLELVVENKETLASRIGSVKVNKIIKNLSEEEKNALLKALASC